MGRKTHGEVQHINGKRVASPEYRVWQRIKNCCLNLKSPDYPYYGGRGITLHPEWLDFTKFLEYVGRRPGEKYTLDRINGNRGYEPGNVRWATRLTQSRNRVYAKTKAWELAEQLGVKPTTAHHYIWRVRALDEGRPASGISPELAEKVRVFLRGNDA